MLKDIKYTGINTASNAYDAPAGQLAVAHNVINEHGYLERIAYPGESINYSNHSLSGYRCVFKHEMLSGIVNYIFYKPEQGGGSLMWLSASAEAAEPGTEVTWQSDSPVKTSIATASNLYEVTAVGNTLCVLTAAGMDYLVWTTREDEESSSDDSTAEVTSYFELGTSIPNVTLQFAMKPSPAVSDTFGFTAVDSIGLTQEPGYKEYLGFERVTDEVMTAVTQMTGVQRDRGKIGDPFLVRYALRLFDGTLVKHSAPIYMGASNPEVVEPFVGLHVRSSEDTSFVYDGFVVYYLCGELYFKSEEANFSDWSDIISGVDIFMTKPQSRVAYDHKITSGWVNYASDSEPDYMLDHIYPLEHDSQYSAADLLTYFTTVYPLGNLKRNSLVLPKKKIDETDGAFYKIKNIPIDEINDHTADFEKIDLLSILKNLEVQEIMQDDYHTHDILKPRGSYAYNQRINLFDMTRKVVFDQSLVSFLQYYNKPITEHSVSMFVRLESDEGKKWIQSESATISGGMLDNLHYIFYPDSHAKEIRLIYYNGVTYFGCALNLEEHPSLNGAYWYSDTPVSREEMPEGYPTPIYDSVEFREPNKVYTSEVGNPFYFPIGGINTIGTGKIMALASNVRAISQGQFGEFPLYVFTDNGIWMLEVDDKGLYKAKQPMSLDRILPGSKVTSVDNAVAYVIERGLMLVSGSETKCISDALDGQAEASPVIAAVGGCNIVFNWNSYKKGAVCAYDSTRQRLHVYNPTYDYGLDGTRYHYVYSMRTGQWTTTPDDHFLFTTLNGNYIDGITGLLDVTFDKTENAQTDISTQEQTILTRPISFETDAYKRLRDNIQRGDLDLLKTASTESSRIKVLVQGSDDLHTWQNVAAVTRHYRIIRKSGTPHKWFRWKIVIGSSPEEYRLRGLTADVEVVGNNKLR